MKLYLLYLKKDLKTLKTRPAPTFTLTVVASPPPHRGTRKQRQRNLLQPMLAQVFRRAFGPRGDEPAPSCDSP